MSEFGNDDGVYLQGEQMLIDYAGYLFERGTQIGGVPVETPNDAVRFLHEANQRVDRGEQVFDAEHAQRVNDFLHSPQVGAYFQRTLGSPELQAEGTRAAYPNVEAFVAQVAHSSQQHAPSAPRAPEPEVDRNSPIYRALMGEDEPRQQAPTRPEPTQPDLASRLGDLPGNASTAADRLAADQQVRGQRDEGPESTRQSLASLLNDTPTPASDATGRQPAAGDRITHPSASRVAAELGGDLANEPATRSEWPSVSGRLDLGDVGRQGQAGQTAADRLANGYREPAGEQSATDRVPRPFGEGPFPAGQVQGQHPGRGDTRKAAEQPHRRAGRTNEQGERPRPDRGTPGQNRTH